MPERRSGSKKGRAERRTLSFACKDLGLDCPFVTTGKNWEEIVMRAENHAMMEHDIADLDSDIKARISAAVKEA